jgi:hypothetical protein
MLDFSVVYDGASKREQKVLDKIKGNTLDKFNVVTQLNSFDSKDLQMISDIVGLYKSLNQNTGFIEVLDEALKTLKRTSFIIDKVLKEARV